MHWAEVIWMAYEALKVPVSKAVFRDAYVHGERTLGKNPIVKPHHTFLDMLRLKSDLQIQWLKENRGIYPAEAITPELPEQLADWCYEYARKAIDSARPILEQLAERYPLVLDIELLWEHRIRVERFRFGSFIRRYRGIGGRRYP